MGLLNLMCARMCVSICQLPSLLTFEQKQGIIVFYLFEFGSQIWLKRLCSEGVAILALSGIVSAFS